MSNSGKVCFILLVSSISCALCASNINYNQYKYVGYRNTWHDGTAHEVIPLPSTVNTPKRVEMVCANYCTLDVTCNGFSVQTGTNQSCILVHLSLETQKNLTYGFGQGNFDRVYFVKTELTNQMNLPMPNELAQPCQTDTTPPISSATCATVYKNEITYYTCTASDNTYIGTLYYITDTQCATENRLLQCQLVNGLVDSNINIATRFDSVNPAFLKFIYAKNGYSSAIGDEMTWMEGTFQGGAKNLTRIILRVADPLVDRIQSGSIVLTNAGGATGTVNFTFPSINSCAVSMVFTNSTTPNVKTAATGATKFRLNILSKFSQALASVGFKIDVFTRI